MAPADRANEPELGEQIFYARVSADDQKLDLQRDAAAKAGIPADNIYADEMSGASRAKRPGLALALKRLRAGDVLVVWRLDRLGRSLLELIEMVEYVKKVGAQFRSLNGHIDTTTAVGKLIFHILGAFAEFERNLIRERTFAGMAAAALRGRKGGRRHYVTGERVAELKCAVIARKPLREIAAEFGLKPRTVWNYVKGGLTGLLDRIKSGEEKHPRVIAAARAAGAI